LNAGKARGLEKQTIRNPQSAIQNRNMEAIAKTRNLKGSPRKARLVIDLIRGRNVSQALAILKFTDKRAAEPIEKTLRSAIANATYLAEQQNIAIDPDDLFVKSCFVDMGPHKHRRRMRPAPQGRAYREQRHYCHITVLVSSEKPEEKVKKVKTEKVAKPEPKSEPKAEAKTESKPKKTAAKKDGGETKAKAPAKKKAEKKVEENAEATE
jgi:large subunit ribosomal protein L22